MKRIISIILFILLFISGKRLEARGLGITLNGGTMGSGINALVNLTPEIDIQAGIGYMPYTLEGTMDQQSVDVNYTADIKIMMGHMLANWYPLDNWFHLNGGLVYNGNNMVANIEPAESYTMDDKTFEPDKLGNLDAELNYGSKIAPYLGLGFGKPFRPGKIIGFMMQIGTIYTNSPAFEMSGKGMIGPSASQDQDIENSLQEFKWYPVFSIGLSLTLVQ